MEDVSLGAWRPGLFNQSLRAETHAGGTQLYFGGYVLYGFPKVRSSESRFSLKDEGLGKFCILRAEILAKTKTQNANFSKNLNGGHMNGTLMGNW